MKTSENDVAKRLEAAMGMEEESQTPHSGENDPSVSKKTETASEAKADKPDDESHPTDGADESVKQKSEALSVARDETAQAIGKIDAQIETLQNPEIVNKKTFLDEIDTHMSEEELELELTDRTAFMLAVDAKYEAYVEANSGKEAIGKLEAEKQKLVEMRDIQAGISEVTGKYPDYDHEKMLTFFNEDLNRKEQMKIFDGASSFADVYEKTYKRYLETNPQNIHETNPPNIPDPATARRQPVNNRTIEEGFKNDDEQLQEALGFN